MPRTFFSISFALIFYPALSLAGTLELSKMEKEVLSWQSSQVLDRTPASTSVAKAKLPNAKPTQRRSKLPAAVEDGFELRLHQKAGNAMYWVVRRGDKYELMYVNSSGSKVNLTLSADVFRPLHATAESIRPADFKIDGCRDANMQIHVLTPGQAERTHTACYNAKGFDADRLRSLTQVLTLMVR